MSQTHTAFEVESGVATLSLERPEVRNALTGPEMIDEIVDGITRADRDDTVSVLVVTGSGGAFSAGGNLKEMQEGAGMFGGTPDEVAEAYRTSIQRIPRLLTATDLVTIAAVDGPAIGAGFDLALMCDLRLASTRARFAHTFIDLGIIPGDGGAWFLPRVVGWQRAAELAFTARAVDAAEALQLGIVLEVTEPDRLLPAAIRMARQIAAKPAHSVRLAKRLLRHARRLDLDPFLDLTAALQAISHHTEGHRTAMADLRTRSEAAGPPSGSQPVVRENQL